MQHVLRFNCSIHLSTETVLTRERAVDTVPKRQTDNKLLLCVEFSNIAHWSKMIWLPSGMLLLLQKRQLALRTVTSNTDQIL